MADGDFVAHLKSGLRTEKTNTDALQDFISFDLSALSLLGVDAIVTARGWTHSKTASGGAWHIEEVAAVGVIDGGSLTMQTDHTIWSDDSGSSGNFPRINQDGNTIKLQIATGTSNVIGWHGELEVRITELAITAS